MLCVHITVSSCTQSEKRPLSPFYMRSARLVDASVHVCNEPMGACTRARNVVDSRIVRILPFHLETYAFCAEGFPRTTVGTKEERGTGPCFRGRLVRRCQRRPRLSGSPMVQQKDGFWCPRGIRWDFGFLGQWLRISLPLNELRKRTIDPS